MVSKIAAYGPRARMADTISVAGRVWSMMWAGAREATKAWFAGEEVVTTVYPAVTAYLTARPPQELEPP